MALPELPLNYYQFNVWSIKVKYVIGIDGGGTKTHSILANENGETLFECYGGPSNFLIIGTEQVSETILELINKSVEHLNISISDISSVLIGTTGAGRRVDAEKLENDFNAYLTSQNISLSDFRVESDARVALEGAFSGAPGSILIAGTGSIMFGKDENNNVHRVGGFGRFIGDEGSGYLIGKKGLAAVAKSFDGRGRNTMLTNLLQQKFNISSSENLINEIYKNNFDIASVAPLVLEAAEKGDPISFQILEQETDELLLHIKAMREKILTKPLSISFVGGILSNQNLYSQKLIEKIVISFDDVAIKEKEHSPAYGAVLMALNRIRS